jgi:hypothetical protein
VTFNIKVKVGGEIRLGFDLVKREISRRVRGRINRGVTLHLALWFDLSFWSSLGAIVSLGFRKTLPPL